MKTRELVVSRRGFVGALLAATAWPLLGRPASAASATGPSQQQPKTRTYEQARPTLEQERVEARQAVEDTVKAIRAFRVPVEAEPAFIFRAPLAPGRR